MLEIGFGSGLNLPHVPPEVESVSAVEPSDVGWALSRRRRAGSRVPVERTGLDGQRIEAGDASYDAVLATFTLCTIPDVAAALGEVRRVLRPGGLFHFLEHGLAPDAAVVAWQHRLEPLQRRVFAGCHLTPGRPRPRRGRRAGDHPAGAALSARAADRPAVDVRLPRTRGAPRRSPRPGR